MDEFLFHIIRREERMPNSSFPQIRSSRKSIAPIVDIDEVEDENRRDSSGRKRVAVIQCLLESSTDESDEIDIIPQTSSNILWLTFAEISHIRTVLATLKFNQDTQCSSGDHLCFRCRKSSRSLSFLPSFFRANHLSTCSVCRQNICRKCSIADFSPPLPKHLFPVRIQILIQFSSTSFDKESHLRGQTICYDCSQIFSPHTRPSVPSAKSLVTESRPLFNFNLAQLIHNADRSTQHGNDQKENTITSSNFISTRL